MRDRRLVVSESPRDRVPLHSLATTYKAALRLWQQQPHVAITGVVVLASKVSVWHNYLANEALMKLDLCCFSAAWIAHCYRLTGKTVTGRAAYLIIPAFGNVCVL